MMLVRHAGPSGFEFVESAPRHRLHPLVRRRSCEISHAPQSMRNNTVPSKHQPTISQAFRRTMPNTVQPVDKLMNPTVPKNPAGKNKNGPQRHIFGFGGEPGMIPPVLGSSAASSKQPKNTAPTSRNQRRSRLLSSTRVKPPNE